jgi:hypothetical protein
MAADPRFPALRRKPLATGRRGDDIHVIAAPNPKESTMNQALIQRLLSLSLASVFTLAILGGVSELFIGVEAQSSNVAQYSTPAAPRA